MDKVEQIVTEKQYPSKTSVGLVNKISGARVDVTDDNVIVMKAGNACIIIDGATGQITVDSPTMVTNSGRNATYTTPTGLEFNEGKLNPEWTKLVAPLSRFLKEAAESLGKVPIEPDKDYTIMASDLQNLLMTLAVNFGTTPLFIPKPPVQVDALQKLKDLIGDV
jgi:hypothetical protein